MDKIFIGLDPGAKGFITVYNPKTESFDFYQMPTEKNDVSGQSFSFKGLMKMVENFNEKYSGTSIFATMEEVTGRQGWSAQNNFNFGYVAGAQRMFLEMIGAEILLVRPQKWQSIMYQGHDKVKVPSSTGKTMIHDTKATSAQVAKAMQPNIDFRKSTRAKNIDDNKTDSFLLAMYGFKRDMKSKF